MSLVSYKPCRVKIQIRSLNVKCVVSTFVGLEEFGVVIEIE